MVVRFVPNGRDHDRVGISTGRRLGGAVVRNTVRRPARFWLSVGLLAIAGTVFVAGMSLRSGTQAVTRCCGSSVSC